MLVAMLAALSTAEDIHSAQLEPPDLAGPKTEWCCAHGAPAHLHLSIRGFYLSDNEEGCDQQ